MTPENHFVIVYGALRSGTTLLRLMLDNHPMLSCPGETDFLFDYINRDNNGQWQIDRDALRRDRIFQAHEITCSDKLSPEGTVADLIAQLKALSGNKRLILMTHRAIDTAYDLFPETPIVHMLRDPRDVARSSIGMGWAGNVYYGVDHWIGTERGWHNSVASFPAEQHTLLRYEDLIRDAQGKLSSMLDFIGLSFDPKMLSYDESSTYSAPDVKLIEQWRRMQTPYEVGLVEYRVGDLLERAGYTHSGYPVQNPQGFERLRLKFDDRITIWKERIRRFGFVDPFIVAISQKCHLESWGHAAQQRINEKTKAFLK